MSKESPVEHYELSFMTGLPQVDTFVTLVAHPISRQSEIEPDDGLGDCACAVDQMLMEADTARDGPACTKRVRKAQPTSRKELL